MHGDNSKIEQQMKLLAWITYISNHETMPVEQKFQNIHGLCVAQQNLISEDKISLIRMFSEPNDGLADDIKLSMIKIFVEKVSSDVYLGNDNNANSATVFQQNQNKDSQSDKTLTP